MATRLTEAVVHAVSPTGCNASRLEERRYFVSPRHTLYEAALRPSRLSCPEEMAISTAQDLARELTGAHRSQTSLLEDGRAAFRWGTLTIGELVLLLERL